MNNNDFNYKDITFKDLFNYCRTLENEVIHKFINEENNGKITIEILNSMESTIIEPAINIEIHIGEYNFCIEYSLYNECVIMEWVDARTLLPIIKTAKISKIDDDNNIFKEMHNSASCIGAPAVYIKESIIEKSVLVLYKIMYNIKDDSIEYIKF